MPIRRAFTLVEVLMIVIILGIIAAIVTPQFGSAADSTRRGTFVTDLRAFVGQAEVFRARTGQYLPDGGSGILPPGFEDYIDAPDWESGTPIGGVWDSELNDNTITAAIGVHFDGSGATQNDAYMNVVDAIFDNGDVNTGVFRKLAAGRYYYVMAE